MKVGDRILVFQLNKQNSSSFPPRAEGRQRALQYSHEVGFDFVGFDVYFLKEEMKPICTMVIKSIKNAQIPFKTPCNCIAWVYSMVEL